LAGVVQDLVDVVDSGCSISAGGHIDLAALSGLLGSSPVSTTANMYNTVSPSLTSCNLSTMANLSSVVAGSGIMGGQLTATAATASTGVGVPAGTYTGTVIPIMSSATPATSAATCNIGSSSSIPVTVTVGSNGVISLSSTTGPASFSGTLTGTNFTMSGTDMSGTPPNSASVTGTLVPLSSASVTGGNGFSINGTWADSSNGCSYSGTYNVPVLLGSGAHLTANSTIIPNGSYPVTIAPVMLACSGCSIQTIPPFPATLTITNGIVAYSEGNNTPGTGVITGNTFTLNVSSCGGSGALTATGTMSFVAGTSGTLVVSGYYNEMGSNGCRTDNGTFTGST
ncbi:MAG: hypothetical protein ACYC43_09290, partial [Burkholderiales bacterium]